jgi:hypothetical protein
LCVLGWTEKAETSASHIRSDYNFVLNIRMANTADSFDANAGKAPAFPHSMRYDVRATSGERLAVRLRPCSQTPAPAAEAWEVVLHQKGFAFKFVKICDLKTLTDEASKQNS